MITGLIWRWTDQRKTGSDGRWWERSGCLVQTASGALEGETGMKILKCLLMIVTAPVFWCWRFLSGSAGADLHIRSGAWSTQHGNCATWRGWLITYSPQNGVICWLWHFWLARWDCRLRRSGCWVRCRIWNMRSRIGCMGKWCEYNLEWKEAGQWEMRPSALLLGYLEWTVVYFWFLLLGLSGNIISSLPEDNKGLR